MEETALLRDTATSVEVSNSLPTSTDDSASSTEKTTPRTDANDSGSNDEGVTDATTRLTPMRNISRDRKRAELAALRDQAEALERQRNVLLRLKRKQHETVLLPSHPDKWKRTAETERLTRARAETENERLMAMIEHQSRLSDALESMLRKRAKNNSRDDEADTSPFPISRIQCDTSIGMLHAQFSRDIQRMYKAGIRRIFTGDDWSPARAELGLSVVREDKLDETMNTCMVEMRETRHVPFEYQRVADAMWRCALHPFAEHGRVLESYGSQEDQIAFKYRAARPGNINRGDLLTAVMVMQKFEEHDRTVHVWRVMSSSTEKRASEIQRAFSDESGWIIIEPVPVGIPGMEPGTAVVRFVAQLVPLWPHGHDSDDSVSGSASDSGSGRLKSDDFHDLVVEASCEDMVALGDAVGNLLLDESLGLAPDLQLI